MMWELKWYENYAQDKKIADKIPLEFLRDFSLVGGISSHTICN